MAPDINSLYLMLKSRHWQGKPEAAALADFAFQQNAPVQSFHNFFHYGQPKTAAFCFMFSEPYKPGERVVAVLHWKDHVHCLLPRSAHSHYWLFLHRAG